MSVFLVSISVFVVIIFAIRKYMKGESCKVDRDMTGEVVLITGSNTGIGLETAKELAKKGATIIMGCRDMQKAKLAVDMILKETNNKARVELFKLDLSDLTNVKEFAKQVKAKFNHITMLINNAGVFGILEKKLTKQNLEMMFGTNYIGTFYLTEELLPLFKKENQNRILNVVTLIRQKKLDYSFFDANKKYDYVGSYFVSKLFLIHYSMYLNEQYSEKLNLKAVSIHPGVIDTEITRNLQSQFKIVELFLNSFLKYMYTFFIKTPLEGSQTTLQCALESFDKLKGGKYFQECQVQDSDSKDFTIKDATESYNFTKNFIQKMQF